MQLIANFLKSSLELKYLYNSLLYANFVKFVCVGIFLFIICHVVYIIIKLQKRKCSCGILPHLIEAIEKNRNIVAIKLIEQNPISINKVFNDQGYTPFLLAALRGNTQLVKFMLSHGADISSCTIRKENSFYLAVYNILKNKSNKDASCLHTLFHAGVDINMPNINGYNALQMSAVFGHVSVIKWLYSKNANFEVIPDPCILAHMEGHPEAAKVILNFKRQRICYKF